MKKIYINPNTEIHEIELQHMIADSLNTHDDVQKSFGETLAGEHEMTGGSHSVWDEEE